MKLETMTAGALSASIGLSGCAFLEGERELNALNDINCASPVEFDVPKGKTVEIGTREITVHGESRLRFNQKKDEWAVIDYRHSPQEVEDLIQLQSDEIIIEEDPFFSRENNPNKYYLADEEKIYEITATDSSIWDHVNLSVEATCKSDIK